MFSGLSVCPFAVIVAAWIAASLTPSASAQLPPGTWQYQWGDDFSEETLDTTRWSYNYPWGATHNHDAFMSPSNVVLGDGTLTLVAERTAQGGKPFTSGAVSTGYNRATFQSGYLEARIQLPDTPGSWPAFWGLYDGWPPEIDIMEYPIGTAGGDGYAQDEYHTALHYRNTDGGNSAGAGKVNPVGVGDLGGGYHTFGLEWREDDWVGFYFDGVRVSEFGQDQAVAQMEQMYLILNYAVGGWPGQPSLAEWPVGHTDEMKVDWVRVWQPAVQRTADWLGGAAVEQSWDDNSRWSTGSPNLGGVNARFDGAPVAEQQVNWSGTRTAGSLEFDGSTNYRLGWSGDARLVLAGADGGSTAPSIKVAATAAASQEIAATVELVGDATVNNESPHPFNLFGRVIGAGGLNVEGSGVVSLMNATSHTGETRVRSGTLAIASRGTLGKTPVIDVSPGARIDMTGARGARLTLQDQTLSGGGTVVGSVATAGGVLRVGHDGRVGELTPTLIDDFSDGTLNEYAETRILDQGATDNAGFISSGGVLSIASRGSDGAEQTVLLRDDFSLSVGQELRADADITATADRDLGIVVAATANPQELTRSDYATVFLRSSANQIGSSGFDGTNEMGLAQDFSGEAKDTLFIARTAAQTFELGYYVGDERTVVTTRTLSNAAVGDAIGFYSDLRTGSTISGLDNLRVFDPNNAMFLPATLTIEGDLALSPTTRTELDIQSPSERDRLLLTGDLAAAGVLAVSLAVGSEAPTLGDTFDLFDFGSASGEFDGLELPDLLAGLRWDTSQLLTTGLLSVVELLPGDYNTDGVVDAADYTVWRDHLGQPPGSLPNDPTGAAVGQAQYDQWVGNYGATANAAITVPEPSALTSVAMAVLITLRRRKRKQFFSLD